ncbi:asparagine N-glycosylation enzyme membrane subunit Stt3 [Amycolatopsis magusensis]|uniref:Asparagine N-glycosylation enzyme membrane subunit Stt3 n=2 Tax=Amycolatopsis magusensis TaxID=882444 RepID=A0ABS4PME3_9PSEU|nr:asparagine N-glycosylation enzyme membrane subunit Stt3 [Amycolatopsis magusensis]
MTAPAPPPRKDRRSWLVHLPFAVVMAVVALAALRIGMYHWRQGAALIGGALLTAAVLRGVLSDTRAGLLAIRGKAVDVITYSAFATLILFVALTITRGPGV